MESETNTEEIFYYAGYIILEGDRLGHALINLEGTSLNFKARSFHHYIGRPFSVSRDGTSFTYKPDPSAEKPPEDKLKEWRVQSRTNKQIHDDLQADKKLRDFRNKLDDMTISEMKSLCKTIPMKRALRRYLDEQLFW